MELISKEFSFVLSSKSSIKKKKINKFSISKKHLDSCKDSTYEKTYIFGSIGSLYKLYYVNGKLNLSVHHTYDVFEEIN